jgi:heme exporter protein C
MKIFKKLLSAQVSYNFLGILLPWSACSALVLIIYGLIGGLILAPADYQQGDGFRIIYIHAPAAFLSLTIYAAMAFFALINLVWRIKLANFSVTAAAPIGFAFTLIALISGSFWGKPMWGTWWIWDARLTSELILLFIYIAVIALTHSLHELQPHSLPRNIFVLIGAINLPIIHYSVYWWNSLHQGATLTLRGPSHIAPAMLRPLLAMIIGFSCLFLMIWMMRLRNLILWDARKTRWVRFMAEA